MLAFDNRSSCLKASLMEAVISESLTLGPRRALSLRLVLALVLVSLLEPPPSPTQAGEGQGGEKSENEKRVYAFVRSPWAETQGVRTDFCTSPAAGLAARITHPAWLKPALHQLEPAV
jgi:hypothetical protein